MTTLCNIQAAVYEALDNATLAGLDFAGHGAMEVAAEIKPWSEYLSRQCTDSLAVWVTAWRQRK